MRDIILALDRFGDQALLLGRVGENRATRVLIDLKSILSQYPDAIASITVKQPDRAEYPAAVKQEGGILTWEITSADIGDKPGTGAAQITVRSADGTIIKTAIATTRVTESLGSPQSPAPDPVKGWVANAEEILADVERSGTAAQTIADEVKRKLDAGELTGAPGRDGIDGKPGKDGATGATGATPQIKVEATTGEPGTQASVTQGGTAENPILSFEIPRGDKGERGAKGAPGEPGKDAPQEAVLFTEQALGEAQKTRARENIGAADAAQQNILVGSEMGNPIAVDDAFSAPLCGLTVYGKSTQDGTPTPDAPVPIVSAGDGGTILVTVGDGADGQQTITLQTPTGLPGIPVKSGGNYTDPQGQQWTCDEMDLERGVKVQRVNRLKLKDLSWRYELTSTNKSDTFISDVSASQAGTIQGYSLCQYAVFDGVAYDIEMNEACRCYVWVKSVTLQFKAGSGVNSVDAFSEWLKARPDASISYCLATPIETPLTPSEIAAYKTLTAYAPDTVVQASDGAGLKLGYQRDVNIAIKKLEDAIASITAT